MPILGVVAVLSSRPDERAAALAALQADPRVTPGDPQGDRLPLVLETRDRADDKACWAALEAIPGLVALDVAFADFSDLHPQPSEVTPWTADRS
jgi:hypothetical protein